MAKFLQTVFVVSCLVAMCSGSAIPMWEYLARGEKMSHLYSMFAKQVSSYCKAEQAASHTPVTQCKRELLMYGVDKLQKMSESHLDTMDPYQRGAMNLIWDTMMEGHPVTGPVQEPTTVQPIYEPTGDFEKNPLFDDKQMSSQATYATGMETYQYPTAAEVIYKEPQNALHQEAASDVVIQFDFPAHQQEHYLTGPMVIRVRPDGTPVEEDKNKPLPKDDDREALQLSNAQLPTVEQISETFRAPKETAYVSNYRTNERTDGIQQ